MLTRDGYLPGVPCWVDTSQPDPEAAAAFYGGLFGWDFTDATPPGAPAKYLVAHLHDGEVAAVASAPEGGAKAATWNTYVWVPSADDAVADAVAAGGRVVTAPVDVGDAGRAATIADPEGAELRLWQAGRHRGARIVNEPGTLNFNGLNTHDEDRAESFYGSLFGWETLGAPEGPRMWRLPGYGAFLERSDPALRRRQAESGAPDGFWDVVATLIPIADDRPAHWSVTFSVADADATAERAAALGGQVVIAPFDAPWVRMTVITDPQGATFTASRFVPENGDLLGGN